MENRFTLRRGDTPPSTENLMEYELGWDKQGKRLYMNDGGESVSLMMHEDEIQQMIDSSIQEQVLASFFDWVYPVGSLYWSQVNTDPSTLFPGTTWTQITNKFIYAAPNETAAKTSGGASTVTLSTANMPSHTHTMSGSTNSATPSMRLSGSTSSAGSHWHYIDDISMDGSFDVRCRSNTDWIVNYSSGAFSDSGIQSGLSNGPSMAGSGGGYQTVTFDAYDGFSSGSTDSDGSHSHSLSNVSVTGGSHSHTISASIGSAGSGQAFDIMPPYETAYCWRRES